MAKRIQPIRLGLLGNAAPSFASFIEQNASAALTGDVVPTFDIPGQSLPITSTVIIGESEFKAFIYDQGLFNQMFGDVAGALSAIDPQITPYLFNNAGVHKGVMIMDQGVRVKANAKQINFEGVNIEARLNPDSGRVDVYDPPLNFNPSLTVRFFGGPFTGSNVAEKGYVADALSIAWATNDPTIPIQNYDQLTLNSQGIVLSPVAIATGGRYTNTGAISEAFEGSGISVRLISAVASKTVTGGVSWLWRSYWGNATSAGIDEAGIEALSNSALASVRQANRAIGAAPSNYKWIAYPVSFGYAQPLTGFVDVATGFFVPMNEPLVIPMTNTYGASTDYYAYRSTNMLGGAVTLGVK